MVLRLKSVEELFSGRHFDREIIILCVRWYLRYKLSFRDLVEMMVERGLQLAHTTIMRWFEKRWAGYLRPSGRSWRVDETYLKVRGRWVYLYRVSCGGPGWQNCRFPVEPEKGCGRRQVVLTESASHLGARSHQDYSGWLCCVASRRA